MMQMIASRLFLYYYAEYVFGKWNSRNHESSEDKSENVVVQTRYQSNTARSKKDSGTDHSNRSDEKLIGKIAQTTTTNSCANNEKTRNSVQQKAVNNVDDEDDDDDDNYNNNNSSDNNKLQSNYNEKRRGNDNSDDDEISQSGFSNGSSDERSNSNKYQKDGDESIMNKATGNLHTKII